MSFIRQCNRCKGVGGEPFAGPRELGEWVDLCPNCMKAVKELVMAFIRKGV